MKLQDLIKAHDFNEIWPFIRKEYVGDSSEYETAEYGYGLAYQSLGEIEVNTHNNEQFVLTVMELEDYLEADITKTMEVILFTPQDTERYGIVLSAWSDCAGYEVCEKSLAEYGAGRVLAAILNELTFFGYTEEYRSAQLDDVREKLAEAEKDVDAGRTIPAEEVFEKFGYRDSRTDADKEADQKRMAEAVARNTEIINSFRESMGMKMIER